MLRKISRLRLREPGIVMIAVRQRDHEIRFNAGSRFVNEKRLRRHLQVSEFEIVLYGQCCRHVQC